MLKVCKLCRRELIGATTENPSFEVNSALLSRCKVFVLKPLEVKDIIKLLQNALHNPNGFGKLTVKISEQEIKAIAKLINSIITRPLSKRNVLH